MGRSRARSENCPSKSAGGGSLIIVTELVGNCQSGAARTEIKPVPKVNSVKTPTKTSADRELDLKRGIRCPPQIVVRLVKVDGVSRSKSQLFNYD